MKNKFYLISVADKFDFWVKFAATLVLHYYYDTQLKTAPRLSILCLLLRTYMYK